MGFAEAKAKARRVVHDTMARPASFYADPGVDSWEALTVRFHSKSAVIGDLPGTNLNYAETQDARDRLIFWRAELDGIPGVTSRVPPHGALVVFTEDEGYFVDNVELRDGDTVTANVTRAEVSDLEGKTLPDGTVIPVSA